MDDLWWSLRKSSTSIIYVEYGYTHATLFATDIKMRKGPPVTLALSLERNLRTRHKGTGTYTDAAELARGDIRSLTRLHVHDTHVLDGLRRHLAHAEDISAPWRLLLVLGGQEHEFTVRPEFDGQQLRLFVATGAGRA